MVVYVLRLEYCFNVRRLTVIESQIERSSNPKVYRALRMDEILYAFAVAVVVRVLLKRTLFLTQSMSKNENSRAKNAQTLIDFGQGGRTKAYKRRLRTTIETNKHRFG